MSIEISITYSTKFEKEGIGTSLLPGADGRPPVFAVPPHIAGHILPPEGDYRLVWMGQRLGWLASPTWRTNAYWGLNGAPNRVFDHTTDRNDVERGWQRKSIPDHGRQVR